MKRTIKQTWNCHTICSTVNIQIVKIQINGIKTWISKNFINDCRSSVTHLLQTKLV